MGCTNSIKRKDSDAAVCKSNENGLKNVFYATTEFDLSSSDSENEDKMFSIKSITNNKEKLTKNINQNSTAGLTTINNNPSTTNTNTLLDNRLSQTYV